MTQTPARLGYRFPAEWEPHEATWLSWPKNPDDWPGKMTVVPWVYAEMVRALAPGETVRILVNDAAMEKRAASVLRRAGAPLDRVEFWRMTTDRSWTRDFGPIHLVGPKGRAILDFHFNGWAKYDDWKNDTKVAAKVAKRTKLPLFDAKLNGRPLRLEGGGIEVNGLGTVITTEECYLDPKKQVRNPGVGRADYERAFADYLNAPNTLWLNCGVAGDDTHGHIDDICRFVNPTTLVLAVENDPSDVNYEPLQENRERLQGMRLQDGARPTVAELPMPGPIVYDGNRLPASYANFYIANGTVIVPTFNHPNDRVALGILQELMPDRRVVGIHAVDLVWGLGTLHCLTQQEPATTRRSEGLAP
ncbi:MAG: agmatine deiminase family protein [Nitrospinae bacterium]|nr:agmatine deiminase family protein [Nitrospinota bacterium]